MWRDGKEFYTKGIAVLNAKEDKWEKPDNLEEESKLLREVGEACYINRALCNLELSMTSALHNCLTVVLGILTMARKLPLNNSRLRVYPQTQPEECEGLL